MLYSAWGGDVIGIDCACMCKYSRGDFYCVSYAHMRKYVHAI